MQIWDKRYDWSVENGIENDEDLAEDDYISDEWCSSNEEEEEEEETYDVKLENNETDEAHNGYETTDDYTYYYDYEAKLSCDTCDKEFFDYTSYEKHMSEHITCNIEGCTFTAHQKVVDNHVKMQHSNGLYDKIRNTSTPADIKKWIEDRKRNYPSKENIEKRRRQQEKLLQRGERITAPKDRFDKKNKMRLQKPPAKDQPSNVSRKTKKKPKYETKPKSNCHSLIDEKFDWNGNMFPFRGTASLLIKEEKIDDDFDDTEWAEEKLVKNSFNAKIVLNNSLGALMGAYNTSDESDTEHQNTQSNPNSNETTCNTTKIKEEIKVEQNIDDDEAPTEEKTTRNTFDIPSTSERNVPKNDSIKKRPRKCKRTRNRFPKTVKTETSEKDVPFLQRKFRKRKRTLLESLLANDIRHERNVILQCVRYVVNRNFFQS